MPTPNDDDRIRVLKQRAAHAGPQNGLLDFFSGHTDTASRNDEIRHSFQDTMARPRRIGITALCDALKQAYPDMIMIRKPPTKMPVAPGKKKLGSTRV